MAISRFTKSSVAQGLPKYNKLWDGITVLPTVGGYIAGGNTGSTYYNAIRKMPVSTETFVNISGTLTNAVSAASVVSNSGNAGYILGGADGGGVYSWINKISQTSDAKSTISATLTNGMTNGAGMSNQGSAGYILGGSTAGGGVNRIDKLTFSGETKSTLSATISSADGYIGTHGVHNKGVAGYTIVRDTTNAEKLSFTTETTSVLSGFRSNAGYFCLGSTNDGVAGYITGGFDIPNNLRYPSSSDKIAYSTETRTTIANTITDDGIGGQRHGGYYNGGSFGIKGLAAYHAGGYREAYLDVLDKLTFSNDTKTSLGSGRLVVSGLAGNVGFASENGY